MNKFLQQTLNKDLRGKMKNQYLLHNAQVKELKKEIQVLQQKLKERDETIQYLKLDLEALEQDAKD